MDGHIIVYNEGGMVHLETPMGTVVVYPRVAVELAQSLMLNGMEADPDMDVEEIVDEYIAARQPKEVH